MCLAGHGQRQDIYLSGKHNLTLMQRDAAFLLQDLRTKGDDIEENLVDPKELKHCSSFDTTQPGPCLL